MRIYHDMPNTKEIEARIEHCRLSGAEALDLSHLYMTELPAEIERLDNLTTLDVSSNKLQSLPDWIGRMRSL